MGKMRGRSGRLSGSEGGGGEVLAHLEHRPREFETLGEAFIEGTDEAVHLLLPDDEGGGDLQHVHVASGHLGEDAVLFEEVHHYELGEEADLGLLEEEPGAAFEKGAGFLELDGDHEALAAHLLDEIVFSASPRNPAMSASPMRALFSTTFSASITSRVARAAAIAMLFRPKVVEWTTQRSRRLKVLS